MKKIFGLFLMIIAIVPLSVSAQQWAKVSLISPNDGLRTVVISETGTIIAFGYCSQYYVSPDGISWQTFTAPIDLGIVEEAIEYSGKVYLATTSGLYKYDIASNQWETELIGPFFTLAKNANSVLAAGYQVYMLENGAWIEQTELEQMLAEPYEFFAAAAGNGNTFSVVINSTLATSPNAILVTYTGGIWTVGGELSSVVSTDGAMNNNNEYSVVGIGDSLMLSSSGADNFSIGYGMLFCSLYSGENYWAGGYYSSHLGNPDAKGILMLNGDTTTAFIADAPIEEISSNGVKMAAIDRLGGVYMADALVGVEEPVNLPFFYVYPNPTAGQIYFSLPASEIIRIFSLSGSLLKEQKMPAGKNSSDLSAYPPGMYIIQAGNGIKTKVVKR